MIRRRYCLRGVVQGVGFRPHVALVAARHQITGFCGNDSTQVFIEAQGHPESVAAFIAEVLATLPPLAQVFDQQVCELPTQDEPGFTIVSSRIEAGARTLIPPDVATCADCRAELHDQANRRYHYPFINCTNCGPRLTIIEDLPYDRPNTTMRRFEMCPACRAEYSDPANRRYHAQPISCFDCGPRIWLAVVGSDGEAASGGGDDSGEDEPSGLAAVAAARQRLANGEILSVKGLGGFHLLCDARNEAAVSRLRAGKRGSEKPFAVLVDAPTTAQQLAILDDESVARLQSPAAPIVIARQNSSYDLALSVAPNLTDVGVLLPYTAIHELLLWPGAALVATSGNLADEPLAFDNAEALARLANLADGFLLHDREIYVPVEDSVYLESSPVRRSRGFAPLPVSLPPGPTVLAVGGEIKNTFALAVDDYAFVSAHIGDAGSLATRTAFERAVASMLRMHRVRPEVVVCDLHPGYATTSWAESFADTQGLVLLGVQHHYAHALALLAEHRVFAGPAVVAALDGTGFGLDGTIWGGEILTLGADLRDWARTFHVPTFRLVGGDLAVRQPWRTALGLAHSWGVDVSGLTSDPGLGPIAERELVASQLASGFGVVATSSLGRVFDAASAILGVCTFASYEAQAAMELEQLARSHRPTEVWAWGESGYGSSTESWPALFEHLLDSTHSPAARAWVFHHELAGLLAGELVSAARAVSTDIIGVSGGCALNRLLVAALRTRLADYGYSLLTHRVVPANDGGLSLGQALAGRMHAVG